MRNWTLAALLCLFPLITSCNARVENEGKSASETQFEEKVKAWITQGANLNEIRTDLGRPPLIDAAMSGYADSVELLLSKGADPNLTANVTSNGGETALHLAANSTVVKSEHKALGVVEALIRHNASVNWATELGETPLHRMAAFNRPKMAGFLLEHGARIDAVDVAGLTPLHYAAMRGFKEVTQVLIDRGAAVNIRDRQGRTPLGACEQTAQDPLYKNYQRKDMDFEGVKKILKEHGAQ